MYLRGYIFLLGSGNGLLWTFVVGLPTTVGCYESIWVIVDRMTKFAHIIPVWVKYTAEKLAELHISQIVRLHGVSISII